MASCTVGMKLSNPWCKDLPVVHKDAAGKGYCVFHAPRGEKKSPQGKRLSADEFNVEVFRRSNYHLKTKTLCDLSGIVFEGDIMFSRANPHKALPAMRLRKAVFRGVTDFSNTVFMGGADFFGASFSAGSFREARFNEGVSFSWAVLHEADFSAARFGKLADFSRATFQKADFSGSLFSGEAHFLQAHFNAFADFTSATFLKTAKFTSGNQKQETASGGIFLGGGSFSGLKIGETLVFEGAKFDWVSFLGTDLRRVDFLSCVWPERRGRRMLFDELDVAGEKGMPGMTQKIEKVEAAYRMMRQKSMEEHDTAGAADWHYGEKEMQRRKTKPKDFFRFCVLNLYRLSSGYGNDPARAVSFLLALVFAFSLLLGISGLVPHEGNAVHGIQKIEGMSVLGWHNLKAAVLNTLQYATFQGAPYFKPMTLWGGYLKLLSQVLIPLQALLFAFSIRNRFRR